MLIGLDGLRMRSTKTRRIRWLLAAFIAVVLFAGASGFIWEQTARRQDRQHLFRTGRPVDVGGRTLNIECEGSGGPAVILESGGGGYGGYGWRTVQRQVAQSTTGCWYDRAGEGWSDSPNSPRTSTTVIDDLHELLHRANVPAPYLLVGHSIGGEYVRIFDARYPSEVAGMILVDSTHPDQQEPPMLQSPINRAPMLAAESHARSCL
jgi:pimeloyl-ACP methyl ester carboxylesterase